VWWSQDLDWLAVGEALADATLELHRTVWPAAGEWDPVIDDIAPDARPAALRCHARADDLQRRLTASGHQLDDESRRWVQQQLPPLDQPDDAEAIRLIHGDLVIGNVGLTRTDGRWRVTGVFDLEAARVGEPEDDVIVHLWWACFGGRPEAAVSFLRRYRPDGAFSPRLHAYLVLSLLANWEFGQRNHEPWYGDARTFTEWARPLTAAVDRVLAEAYGSTRGGA
jgi:aminoglycoside phosphotransferase (APT) family kinase protein